VQRSLLVYDGSNAVFRAAAEAVTCRSETIRAVRWDSAPIQAFLDAQFDGRPFAFMLVEDGVVHVGGESVARVLRRTGVDDRVVEGLSRAYSSAARPITRVVHGRPAADLHGTFQLRPAAATHLEPLRRVAEIPVEEG
jgi:hypothetical protein